MADIKKLEQLVKDLYQKKDPKRDRWSDWMYVNHVLDVAEYAEQLAHRFNESPEVCRAAALLHDIADAKLSRSDPKTEEQNHLIAKHLLEETDFNDSEKDIILNDALPFHSCHGDDRPKTRVGKILSTADALSHINSEFYPYFDKALASERTEEQGRQIVSSKLHRDFDTKIFWDEIREEVKKRYEDLLTQYG